MGKSEGFEIMGFSGYHGKKGSCRGFLLGFLFIIILVNSTHFAQPAPSQWHNGPPEIILLSPQTESFISGDTLYMHWDFENNSEILTDVGYSGYIKNFTLISPFEGESFVEVGLNFSNYRREYVYNFSKNHFTSANTFQKINFTFVIYYLAGADEWGPGYCKYEYSVEYTWVGYDLGNFWLIPIPLFITLICSIVGLVALTIYLVYRIRKMKRQHPYHG